MILTVNATNGQTVPAGETYLVPYPADASAADYLETGAKITTSDGAIYSVSVILTEAGITVTNPTGRSIASGQFDFLDLHSSTVVSDGGGGAGTDLSYDANLDFISSSTGAGVTLPTASPTNNGLMSASDYDVLQTIETGAQVNLPTNLGYTASTRELSSSTGSGVEIPLVSSGDAGLAPATGGGVTNFLRADGTWAAPDGGTGTDLTYTAATRSLNSSTGADVTLPLVSSADAGLSPASGGGTTNYLRADGTWAAPPGGGATNLGYTAATRVLTSDTGTDVTLPLVTSGNAGLAPASGGGTSNYLRADGTWAAPASASATDLTYTAATRTLNSSTGADVVLPLVTSTEAGLAPLSGGGTSNYLRADGTWAAPSVSGSADYVGEYASAAALQTAYPAASNDGRTGTVGGALYKADAEATPAWVALVTVDASDVAWAKGSPLEVTYTQSQLDALLLGRGNVISRASRPIIRPSSGNITSSVGAFTLNTGIDASWTIPGGSMPCWIYLPGGTVPGYGSAQLHAATMLTATTGTLTGVSGATVAAFTTNAASFLTLHSFTLTANEFGANGELEIVVRSTHAGSMTSAHEIQFQLNGTSFGGTSNSTTSYRTRVSTGRLAGRGKDAASQIGMWDVAAVTTSNTAVDSASTFLTVDTTSDRTVAVCLKAPATSTVVLDMVRATLWKS
jgi:hypothetical protein